MNPYIDRLIPYIAENHPGEDPSLLETPYSFFTEFHPIDSVVIQSCFRHLDDHFRHLTPKENDQVFDLICQLCAEHERLAFLEGIRVGACLIRELDS